jgi:hypothetical protein
MSQLVCPHCNQALTPLSLPEAGGWDAPFHMVCFNDECPYFQRGWEWMEARYGVKTSYRHRVDPATGQASPLPVWSRTALRDRILDAEVTTQAADDVPQKDDVPEKGDED